MRVMAGREGARPLDGRVETGPAHPGGRHPGGRGRGAAGERPFVAAASTGDDRRPRKIKLLPAKGFRKEEVERLVAGRLASTGRIVTDGLSRWTAAAEAGLGRAAIVTGCGKRAAGWSPFERVDTTLGDVKAAVAGAYRRVTPGHAGRHLAGSARRRFRLDGLIPRLAHGAVRTAPTPCRQLVAR
jgi:hypothetical protein